MYKGEPTKGLEFYRLLNQSNEFTSALGRVALASGKLEAELILFLKRKEVKGKYQKATLGTLISFAKENSVLDRNTVTALKMISEQRNYLTHNIFALFSDLIDETILGKENLLDTDVHSYLGRAMQLKEDLDVLADIISKK